METRSDIIGACAQNHKSGIFKGEEMLSFYLSIIDNINDKCQFEELYLLYRYTMLKVAENVLHDFSLAEDAVHEAFLRILPNMGKIDVINCNKTRAFAVIVVKNISLDMLRSMNRHPITELAEWEELPAGYNTDPEQVLLGKESREAFSLALSGMKKTYADVLALSVAYELSDKEIAGVLGITAANVRIRLYRGRQELIQYFREGTKDDGTEK